MIRRDNSNTTDLQITLEGGGIVELNYITGIQFPEGSPGAIAFIEALLFEHPLNMKRIRLNQLPNNDPDRNTDPGIGIINPAIFWDGPGQPGNTDLVSVSSYYTVIWDGEKYQYSSRRARYG